MDKIKSIFRILPILNIGTYHGRLNPDYQIDSYSIDQDKEDGYVNFTSEEFWCDGFNSELYNKRIIESAQYAIDESIVPVFESLGLGITGIEVTGTNSPQYYNFRDDWLEFDIIVKNKFTLIEALKSKFNEITDDVLDAFFHENYGSYDGFHSFMSSSAESVLEGITEGKDDEICQFLYYILSNHEDCDINEWNDLLEEHFREDFYYTEFINEGFYEKFEDSPEVIKFIQDNYQKYDRDEMVVAVGNFTEKRDEEDGMWFEDSEEETKRTVNNVIDGIEKHNLKLNLDI